MPPDPSALQVDGLGVRYADVVALADVDLTVERGELLAIVGPSGCGKSSLLRAVAGLVRASGAVRAFGRSIQHLPPHLRGVGVVFQDHALFPHLDVAGNVAFGLVEARVGPAVQRARTAAWLDRVGMADRGGDDVEQLSGGERQRVALARTLAPQPQLVVLDEPFASLDPGLRARLSAEVAGWLRDLHASTLFVTHDLDEALAVADRIAVLRAGRLVQLAAPTELLDAPAGPWTARFLGYENVWTGAAAAGLPAPPGTTAPPAAALLLADRVGWWPDAGPPPRRVVGTEAVGPEAVPARLVAASPRRDGWRLDLEVPAWQTRIVWGARPRELPGGRPPEPSTWGTLRAPSASWRWWAEADGTR